MNRSVRNERSSQSTARRIPRFILGLLVLLPVVAALVWTTRHGWRKVELADIEQLLRAEQFARAEKLALQAARHHSRPAEAYRLAAEAAGRQGRWADALRYLQQVPDDGSSAAVEARCMAGDIRLLQLKHLSPAEDEYRRALAQDPEHLSSNDHLAYLLGIASRNWEQIPYRIQLIARQRIEPPHLYSLSLGDDAQENDHLLPEYLDANPDDPSVLLGAARVAIEQQRFAEAEQLLQAVVAAQPGLLEAHAKLGQLWLRREQHAQLQAWLAKLPPQADRHPAIWVVRGLWAQQRQELEAAARCFWEAVRLDANRQQANYQLGQTLVQLGRVQEAQPFFERARGLQEFVNSVKVAMQGPDPAKILQAAEVGESLGLFAEAYAWRFLRRELTGTPDERLELLKRGFTPHRQVRSLPEYNPAGSLDLSSYAVPAAEPQLASAPIGPRTGAPDAARIPFRDDARRAGLDFRYFNGGDPQQGIRYMYEFTGGGIGVLDFDQDGWPDVYFAQGCCWPADGTDAEHVDRLLRNASGQFRDVTRESALTDSGFGQGVACGDYDGDGFPDLYVGTTSANRFYRNNGDGTFTDVTDATATAGNAWTSSCAFADLNADGLADLYVVNYLGGPRVFTHVCQGPHGSATCMPQYFPAAQDELYLNQGDGSFLNATSSSGIQLAEGKGLGIVVGDFAGLGRNDIFVANDSVPNFLFTNLADPAGPLRFREEAFLRGVAVDDGGKAEACMGVAADDVDGNERLDLLVTNFYLESNTLYSQEEPGCFTDQTRRARLSDPSLYLLGFGAQFLDVELDGRPDLFITNGHIGDFRHEGSPYAMRPQFFGQLDSGQFAEVIPGKDDDYFSREYLGRAAVRCDWNRDGKEDLIVGHLDAPAALLTNTSPDAGHYLAVNLHGTASSRDAVGAIVKVTCGPRSRTRHRVAGDGYLASNQSSLVFGLGASNTIEELTVTWPSGKRQSFTGLLADQSIAIVEGSPEVYVLSKP